MKKTFLILLVLSLSMVGMAQAHQALAPRLGSIPIRPSILVG